MNERFLSAGNYKSFMKRVLAPYNVLGPRRSERGYELVKQEGEAVQLPQRRMYQPMKPLFFPPREDLGPCFEGNAKPGPELAPRAIVGMTACDLAALKILDYVFLQGDFTDDGYRTHRDNTFIISVDCTEPADVCFCTQTERQPYADSGFDINLSPVTGGFVVESGGEAGQAALDEVKNLHEKAAESHVVERDGLRTDIENKVKESAVGAGMGDRVDFQEWIRECRDDAPIWAETAEKCVECGACNFICPSCHCFLLADTEAESGFRRFKNWDACIYPAFALEAGGSNPRARRRERLYGRLQKKFDFIPANCDGLSGCVGCGRCVEACAGEIDIRDILKMRNLG